MKGIPRLPRVFLDTSTLLSGLNSPFGASGVILSLFAVGRITIIISPEVIVEAERAIEQKFPKLRGGMLHFLSRGPEITRRVTMREALRAQTIIHSEDAPIFAGAVKGKARYLVTLDREFQRLAHGKAHFTTMSPGEFLTWYRARP